MPKETKAKDEAPKAPAKQPAAKAAPKAPAKAAAAKAPAEKTSAERASPKKAPAKAAESKAAASESAPARKVNPALMKPLTPTKELATVVGAAPLPRPEVVKKVWAYIKENKLQNPENAREIVADDNLRKVFGRDKVTMFEMNKYLAQHLK